MRPMKRHFNDLYTLMPANAIVAYCLAMYQKYELTQEECLVECIFMLAQDNQRLTEMCIKLMENSSVPYHQENKK